MQYNDDSYVYLWSLCKFASPSGKLCGKPHMHSGNCEHRIGGIHYIWHRDMPKVVELKSRDELENGINYYVSKFFLETRGIKISGMTKMSRDYIAFSRKNIIIG